MPKAKSPHATARRYWSGCRCADCLAAHNSYCRANHAKHGNPIVSAGRSREHLLTLKTVHGVTADAVALETGINRRDIMQIRNGRHPRIREAREAIILAVGPEAKILTGMVPAEKTRQRLKAISAAGLSQKEIGKRLNLKSKPRIARKAFVRADKARAVRMLYHEVVRMNPGRRRACPNPSFVKPMVRAA